MNDFFNSYHCKSGIHCSVCRDIDKNDFRKEIFKNFSNINKINFECPYDKPWTIKKEGTKMPVITKYYDNDIVNIDIIKNNLHIVNKIKGLQKIVSEYDIKIKNSRCSSCLRSRINRELNKILVSSIRSLKDVSFLDGINETLILKDGVTDKTIADWKRDIKNGKL